MCAAASARTRAAALRARTGAPFDTREVGAVVEGLGALGGTGWDRDALAAFLAREAGGEVGGWRGVERAAAELRALVGAPGAPAFDAVFERVLVGGGWAAAERAAAARAGGARPWAVLVTGVNGVRKTTSVGETWWREALARGMEGGAAGGGGAVAELPAGGDSFFRQLDYLVATIANTHFEELYAVEDVEVYAELKDAVFARHRRLAEIVGALLVAVARERGMNVLVETSGRSGECACAG